MEEVGRGDVAGALPLHLLQDAHREQDRLAPQGARADEHGVGGQGVLLGELLGARLEALADVDQVGPNILGLLNKLIELREAAAAVEQAQAEAVGEVVALLAAARTMVRSHGDAVLGAASLADGALGLGHGVEAHAHALHLLDGLEDLGGGAGLGGGEHDGLLGHALVAHDVPLGGVDQVDLEVAVAELVHEVLELHELVPGAADAHQEHGVVALVGDLVGERGHLLAGLVDVLAVLDVALLAKVHDLDLLGFLHLSLLSGVVSTSPMPTGIKTRLHSVTLSRFGLKRID